MNYDFNAKEAKNECIEWIKEWFQYNTNSKFCIVGISGGINSAVTAALCVEALGKDKVVGVIMPDGDSDLTNHALDLADNLHIYRILANIEDTIEGVFKSVVNNSKMLISQKAEDDLLPRLRMSTLYSVAQSFNGKVANTTNYSKTYVGDTVRWGDDIGDFSPLANFTESEVFELGKELGLPKRVLKITKPDNEEKWGFTYDELDKYIRTGICTSKVAQRNIDYLHKKAILKYCPIQSFNYHKEPNDIWSFR